MFKEERREEEKTERKIGKEIFPKGKIKISLEVFDFQTGGKYPTCDQEKEDES